MKMQFVCESNELSINDITETLQERPDILRLLIMVNDDPKLIDIAIVLAEIQSKKNDVKLDSLKFLPKRYKIIFQSRAINGILSFDNYLKSVKEVINLE